MLKNRLVNLSCSIAIFIPRNANLLMTVLSKPTVQSGKRRASVTVDQPPSSPRPPSSPKPQKKSDLKVHLAMPACLWFADTPMCSVLLIDMPDKQDIVLLDMLVLLCSVLVIRHKRDTEKVLCSCSKNIVTLMVLTVFYCRQIRRADLRYSTYIKLTLSGFTCNESDKVELLCSH